MKKQYLNVITASLFLILGCAIVFIQTAEAKCGCYGQVNGSSTPCYSGSSLVPCGTVANLTKPGGDEDQWGAYCVGATNKLNCQGAGVESCE